MEMLGLMKSRMNANLTGIDDRLVVAWKWGYGNSTKGTGDEIYSSDLLSVLRDVV